MGELYGMGIIGQESLKNANKFQNLKMDDLLGNSKSDSQRSRKHGAN